MNNQILYLSLHLLLHILFYVIAPGVRDADVIDDVSNSSLIAQDFIDAVSNSSLLVGENAAILAAARFSRLLFLDSLQPPVLYQSVD